MLLNKCPFEVGVFLSNVFWVCIRAGKAVRSIANADEDGTVRAAKIRREKSGISAKITHPYNITTNYLLFVSQGQI